MSLAAQEGLPDAVASLVGQEGVETEVLVVNSAGGDPAELLRRSGLAVPVIDRPERLTPGAVRNLGIAATRAPVVAFLAADCVAEPGWAAARVRRHRAGARAVASMVVNPRPRNLPACTTQALLFLRRMPGTPPSHRLLFGLSYDRELLLRHGPFDEGLEEGEDAALNRRVAEEVVPEWAPEVRIAHRHPTSVAQLLRDQYRRGGRSSRALGADLGRTAREVRLVIRRVRDIRRMSRRTDDAATAAQLRRGLWLAPPAVVARYAGFAAAAAAGAPLDRFRSRLAGAHRGRMGPLLRLPYAIATRAIAALMRASGGNPSVYLTGSAAEGELVPGISDLDVIVVAADAADRERLDALRGRLARRVPLFAAVCQVFLYTDDELRDAARATHLTFDLHAAEPRGSLLARPNRPRDEADLRRRPRRARPEANWRLVAGPDRRPAGPPPTVREEHLAGWLELQYWWRHAYWLVLEPRSVRARSLATKLICEPARVWLRISGLEPGSRAEAIARAAARVPAWERHLEATQRLADGAPVHVRWALDALVDLTEAVAARLVEDVRSVEHVAVALEHTGPAVPLADWRARAGGDDLPRSVELVHGDPRSPDALRRLLSPAAVQPVLDLGSVLLLPQGTYLGCLMRAAQCPPTDPVTFALLRGEATARFPAVAGLSIADAGTRALAEHRSWLADHAGLPVTARNLARYVSAAGAAVTAATSVRGQPAIGTDPEAIARLVHDHLPHHGEAIGAAVAALRAHEGGEPIPAPVAEAAELAARALVTEPLSAGSRDGAVSLAGADPARR